MALSKEKKIKIKKVLENSFCREDCVQCYFVKFSKGFEGHQYKIVFKTRKKISPGKIEDAEKNLLVEFGDDLLHFARWSDVIGKILPKSKVYKIPFFDSRDVEVKSPWRRCPIGQHLVSQHDRQKKNLEDVDPHCRRNPSAKDLLKGEEIDLISTLDIFTNPKVKVSSHKLGFKFGNKYDDLISGWTAYWNDVFKIEPPLHPNAVKALMATESSFITTGFAKNKNPKIGLAKGLIQITEETYRILKDSKGEIKDHYVELEDHELWEPNKNICAAVRWLFRKRDKAEGRLERKPSWEEVLIEYKGRTRSKSKETQDIKARIRGFLKDMGEV